MTPMKPHQLQALQEAAERSDTHALPSAGGYVAPTSSAAVPGLPVAGYRPQDPKNVELVNRNKVIEEHVLRQIDLHKADQNHDQRLVALAKTHIDLGFMLLNRAVFQPGRLTGELPPL